MSELVRSNVVLKHRPELLSEFKRLIQSWQKSQKETKGNLYKKDPMAEFERLFKLWERSKNIINKQMFYFEMEKDY